jgi:hypothetical protein
MNFSLQIQLDTNHQRRILELSVGPDGTLEEIT